MKSTKSSSPMQRNSLGAMYKKEGSELLSSVTI
jgi:hypothetical protein